MEILIQEDSVILIVGNLITNIAVAIFAFSVWFIQKLNGKYILLINNYRLDNRFNEINFMCLLTAIELTDISILDETMASIENKGKNNIRNVLSSIIKKSIVWKKIQLISLFLFVIGIFIQLEIIILSF